MTILSGMSTMERKEDNLKVMKNFEPLTNKESDLNIKEKAIPLNEPLLKCNRS